MVLSGHDHSYGRGMASDNPEVKPSIVYIVSVSGPKLYNVRDKDWMQHKGSMLQLFQNIDIRDDVLTYEAYTASGELYDKFQIKKGKSGKNSFKDYKPGLK